MAVSPVLAVSFLMNVVAVLFVLCAIVLVLIILIQKGKGGGLSGAFGGGMTSGVLGTKVGDFLTWFTVGLAAILLLLAVVMGKWYKPTVADYGKSDAQTTTAPVEQLTEETAALETDSNTETELP